MTTLGGHLIYPGDFNTPGKARSEIDERFATWLSCYNFLAVNDQPQPQPQLFWLKTPTAVVRQSTLTTAVVAEVGGGNYGVDGDDGGSAAIKITEF